MLEVISAGVQASLQGAPRRGSRHLGIPEAGPADPVSMALANRLVGNDLLATCVEISFGGFKARIEVPCTVAVTGASGDIHVSGVAVPLHRTLPLTVGDMLSVNAPRLGARSYLAIASGFAADMAFGSTSTYLPAGFGGHQGRALRAGDTLVAQGPAKLDGVLETPEAFRPVFTQSYTLRACASGETSVLDATSRKALFSEQFVAGRQGTRMGIALTGPSMNLDSDGLMESAPVFPGTIQCPASGTPIILLCDAQTTGGYPRIAQIARCDRHLLGQVRPGDAIRLLERTPEHAAHALAKKRAFLADWLGDASGELF
ncbi:MAG: biotin-dependent carboxyltransferase family protein [Pseudomonadota bacterium]